MFVAARLRILLVLLSGTLGCASLEAPAWVGAPLPEGAFNPAGRWKAQGGFGETTSDGHVVEIKPSTVGGTAWVALRWLPGQSKPIAGRVIVEGDTVYAMFGSATVGRYAKLPSGELEGYWADSKWWYERGDGGDGRHPYLGEWSLRGTTSEQERYDVELTLYQAGDHVDVNYASGGSRAKGAGFVFDDRLVVATVDTHLVTGSYTQNADASFVVAAYKWDGQRLVGSTLWSSTWPRDRDRAYASKLRAETLERLN